MYNKTLMSKKTYITHLDLSNYPYELNKLNEKKDFIDYIMVGLYKSITGAISNDLPQVGLIRLVDLDKRVLVKKDQYLNILKTLEKYFSKHEEYEICSELQRYIKDYV